jgi:hypothetical protein
MRKKKESKVCRVSLIATMEQRTLWSVLCCWAVYKLSKVLGYVVKNVEVYLLNRWHVYKVEFLQGCFIVWLPAPPTF